MIRDDKRGWANTSPLEDDFSSQRAVLDDRILGPQSALLALEAVLRIIAFPSSNLLSQY